jgi:hypothetical protein
VKNTGSGTNEFEAVSRPFGNLQIHSTEECCFSSEYLQLKSCSLNPRLTGNAHKLSIQDSEDADGAVPEMCFATPPSIRKFVASSNDRAAPEQSFATRVLIHDLAKADGDGAVPDRVWSSFELEAYEEEWFPDWRCFSAQDSGLGLSISPRVSKCTEEFENSRFHLKCLSHVSMPLSWHPLLGDAFLGIFSKCHKMMSPVTGLERYGGTCSVKHDAYHNTSNTFGTHTASMQNRARNAFESPKGTHNVVQVKIAKQIARQVCQFARALCCALVVPTSMLFATICVLELVTAQRHDALTTAAVEHVHSVISRLALSQSFPVVTAAVLFVALSAAVCMMMPGQSNALRVPNAWGPEMEATYSFRQFSRDVLLWSIATDADPSRKTALVMLSLRGAAKELSRQIPPQIIVQGGVINGTQVDPLTYLMHSLQERFGNLGEEVRVQAVTELMTFQRKHHEPIDSLLVRFEAVRSRSAEQGGAIVSIQGISWLLLRAIGITDQQLLQLLAPYQGLFPATEQEFTQLKTSLRRMGHVLERAPGNIREGLRQPNMIGQSAFLTEESGAQSLHSTDGWYQQEAWYGSAGDNLRATPDLPRQDDLLDAFFEEDIQSDTDTSSGSEASTVDPGPDPNRTAQELFWAYRQAKSKWRKFMNKGTRSVRRHFKRFHRRKGKGKGKESRFHSAHLASKGKGHSWSHGSVNHKGKGKHAVTAMLAEMSDQELYDLFPTFRGLRTSGKGKGRRGNPKGPDGSQMRCFECNSTEHLAGSCPRRANGSSNPGPAATFFAQSASSEGPLAGIVQDAFFGNVQTDTVIFPMQEPAGTNVARYYMVSDETVHMPAGQEPAADPAVRNSTTTGQEPAADPLVRNDPWSASSSQWSLPTSQPQSYGPSMSRGMFRGFNLPGFAFHRRQTATQSEPAAPAMNMFPSSSFPSTSHPQVGQTSHPQNDDARLPDEAAMPSSSYSQPQMGPASHPQHHDARRLPAEHEAATGISAGSSMPNHQSNMTWADMSRMPNDLRELLPWPIVPWAASRPQVPAFANMPEFEFLGFQEQQQMQMPCTLRDPQRSTLDTPLRGQLEDFHFVQQFVDATRENRTNARVNRPILQTHSQLDPQHRQELHEFHSAQRQVEHSRRRRKRQGHRALAVIETEDAEYDGADDTCPLCREVYEGGDSLLRLVCKHVYHVDCWTQYMMRGQTLQCPICRGGCHIIARFKHPSPALPAEPELQQSSVPSRAETPPRSTSQTQAYNIFTPPTRLEQRRNQEQSPEGTPFFSPENQGQAFPWWPNDVSQEPEAPAAYHTISVPDRAGIIVDPGAYTNLIGEDTARKFASIAAQNGFSPRQWRMKTMYIQGVGNGQQRCEWKVSIPIACQISIDGTQAQLCYFEAPVVGESGAKLPALLGLKSMTAMNASLVMAQGKEALLLPYTADDVGDISRSRRCPLVRAPSGHLLLLVDHWNALKAQPQPAIRTEPMVLHTYHDESAEPIPEPTEQ